MSDHETSGDPRAAAEHPDHPVFAALYGRMARTFEAGPVGAARRDLLEDARGVVVDLGAGIGLNLPYLGTTVTEVHLIEPDRHMIRRLGPKVPENGVIHPVGAERLPFPDAGVDTVLATLTLCTVGDLPAVAAEIRRVLRPGGRLLVLEHVRSEDRRVAAWQDRLDRPWGWFAAGCHPNRDTPAELAAVGFDVAGLRRFTVPGMPLVREWVTGAVTP
jgi:ubiquinone/menaquinone biosynthesis C-methylase UbiE